ncbi:MAG: radical SAM family heme chaperone HemW [Candidatus Margulisiibacteriota bacterium]
MNAPSICGLYIHLPFCKQKCNYCDFVSYAGKEELIDEYVDSLIAELQTLRTTFDTQLATIFFGGGTPTLLKPLHFEKILNAIRAKYNENWAAVAEISVEANPGTVNTKNLRTLRKLGINRISLGAQTFNNHHLKTLGRIHNAKQIRQAMEAARIAGFNNINLDLIFALPGQTLDEWKADLKQALALKPEHLSLYNLQIEEGTKFQVQRAKLPPLPTNETEAQMYAYAMKTLKAAGYHHYEISNFAKSGFECQHNITYWKNGNYLGVGAAASSHVSGNRFDNPRTIEEYLKWVKADGVKEKSEYLSRKNQPNQGETIFMGLRLLAGLEKEKFAGCEEAIKELTALGLLKQPSRRIKLTRKGLFLANEVFRRFV